nr:CoB--CoM heterodisulfide reductase subunit C [Candidatus Sigynarchaeum springense]
MGETVPVKKQFKTDEEYDKELFKDIERRSNIWSCIQCGTCTASCESGRWTALKTRIIIRKVVLGDLSVLDDPDIWLCTTCYNCLERCPRDVRPTDVIIELRNMAAKRGNMHPAHKKTVGFLKETGHAVPINDQIRKQRKDLGLDELPPTLYKFKMEGDDKVLNNIKAKLFNVANIEKAAMLAKTESKSNEKKSEEK